MKYLLLWLYIRLVSLMFLKLSLRVLLMIFWYLGFLVFIVIILLVEKVCWDKCNNLIIIIKGII